MKTILAIAAAAALSITSANATTFYTTSGGFAANGTGGGTSAGAGFQQYTIDGLVLTVTGGLYTDTASAGGAVVTPGLYDAEPRVWSPGTGLDHDGGGGLSNDDDHQVDGDGGNEVLILHFNQQVQLASALFSYVGSNDDFDFFADTNGDGILERLAQDIDIPGSNLASLMSFNVVSNYFGIGASGYNDEWKLKAITAIPVSDVPLPAALPLFLAGLAGFGFASRKIRT
ncbi:VPLPA-CTERM sorting domain-containing protein [Hyphococcus sp.]|uniref:VPLPA-CTERM sorting domain-containing protein n=1 Tax=Hyphococcus sp. TaxID=2038636 RepID=UPI002082D4A5|nr:MAG: hypothetical protein DHS20C04_05260 [Marinicaulis sp.]